MEVKIKKESLEKVLGYLVTRPYAEVAHLIASVQQDLKSLADGAKRPAETKLTKVGE